MQKKVSRNRSGVIQNQLRTKNCDKQEFASSELLGPCLKTGAWIWEYYLVNCYWLRLELQISSLIYPS